MQSHRSSSSICIAAGQRSITYALLGSLFLGASLLAPDVSAQSATTPRGFHSRGQALAQPVKGWVGLDLLPGGKLLSFDGQNLVALDAKTGKVTQTYATLSKGVFGSDVRLSPTGKHAWFCESSAGGVYRYEFASKKLRLVTTLGGNFSIAFSPKDTGDFVYVVGDPGFKALARIYRIDARTGAQDLIAQAVGFAGPLLFDAKGDLYMAPAPKKFGVKGQGKILRWTASQVKSGIGSSALSETQAKVYASGFDNAYDMEFDQEGTLYVTDVSFGASHLFEIPIGGGKSRASKILKVTKQGVTNLRFRKGSLPFERYGTEGSTFFVLSTDFAKNHGLWVLSPKRPILSYKPLSGGQIGFTLTGGVPSSWAIWLLGEGLKTETAFALGHAGLLYPQIGVAIHKPFIFLNSKVDPNGNALFQLVLPKGKGLRFTTQALIGPVRVLPGGTAASTWASSNPVLVKQGS